DLVEVLHRRQHDRRSERQRRHDAPRRQRAIVRAIRNTTRNIIEKDALRAIDYQLFRAGSFTRSQPPTNFAVALVPVWISLRVLSLRISRPAAVLEIIQAPRARSLVLNPAKVDPEV